MNGEGLIKTLEDIGLSPNEAKVYLAALSLGPTTVMQIARQSGLERTNIYRIIDSLEEQGLMSIDIVGLKKRYVAENPDQLEKVLSRRKKQFEKALPDLHKMHVGTGVGEIKYYRGVAGLRSVYDRILEDITQRDFYYVISDVEKWRGIDEKYFEKWIDNRVKRGISIEMLLQKSKTAEEYKRYEQNFMQEVHFLPDGTQLKTDTIVTPFAVVVVDLAGPITTFVIENESLIQAHKQYFEVMWNSIKAQNNDK